MLSPTAMEIAMEESSADTSTRSGSVSPLSPRKRSSKSRQKLVALMLKSLEITLEEYLSDSSSSDDEKFPDRSRDAMIDIALPSPFHNSSKTKKTDKNNKDDKEKKKKKRTTEEIVYDSMNGGQLTSVETPGDGAVVSDEEDSEIQFSDVEMVQEENMGKLLSRQSIAKNKSSTVSSRDQSMNFGRESSRGSSEMSGSNERQLSISDIKKYVLENLPQDVKEKIPEEAWGQIFTEVEAEMDEDDSEPTTKSTKAAFKELMADAKTSPTTRNADLEEHSTSDGVTIDIRMDDATFVSEITSHTMAFQRESAQRQESHLPLEQTYSALERENSPTPRTSPPEKRISGYPSTGWTTPTSLHSLESHAAMPKPPQRDVSILSVQFGTVSVRYFKRILDVNPSVTSGPAIGLGWIYRNGQPMTVDQWESERFGSLSSARIPADLIVPRREREMMLQQLGYTQQDIARAVRDIRKAKDMRRTTVENLNVQHLEEKVENATNMMKNLLRIGKRKGLVR